MKEFEVEVATASCSSTIPVNQSIDNVSESSSISNVSKGSTSDSSCHSPLNLTNKTPFNL